MLILLINKQKGNIKQKIKNNKKINSPQELEIQKFLNKIKTPPRIENTTPPNSLHHAIEDLKTNYSPSFAKRLQKGRHFPCNFVQDQEKNINQLKQIRNKKENTKIEIPCMTFYETNTQCKAENFKIQLRMNEI